MEGALSTDSGADISNFVPAAGSPIRATADDAAPSAPTYTSAALTGTAVRHTFRQSPSLNARTIELLRADGFGKVAADATVIPLGAYGPNQSDAYDDVFEFGYRQTWMRAKNGSGRRLPGRWPEGDDQVRSGRQPDDRAERHRQRVLDQVEPHRAVSRLPVDPRGQTARLLPWSPRQPPPVARASCGTQPGSPPGRSIGPFTASSPPVERGAALTSSTQPVQRPRTPAPYLISGRPQPLR